MWVAPRFEAEVQCFMAFAVKDWVQPERFNGQAQDQDINDSGKLVELFNLLRGIVARREKVLVFFCRTVTSKLLAALMEREFGVRPGILQGAECI
ncbi:hypothetical protein AK812_SmicGene3973 [Symbiodinium microadriaticum]|uniref:Uncharacterized protein n=1 Tax=Symbiodinium microadriaticum TaxID=2951 RepID=A0A1Q9EXM4_SYMMI|nr:hypothetical protein AK812_SmicGene3973 [Symbiodinium microadriaticum]